MMKKKALLSMALVLLCFAGVAYAAEQGTIDLKHVVEVEEQVVNAQGKAEIHRIEASKAKVVPGDTVIYTTTYTNVGTKTADSTAITVPVAEHTSYVPGTAEGKGTKITYSIDKGRTFDTPDKLTVTDADGRKRRATADEYTHIRWEISGALGPGKSGSVSYRARLQ